jgi:competence protein ComEC
MNCKKRVNPRFIVLAVLVLMLVLACLGAGCDTIQNGHPSQTQAYQLKVIMLDVGQGDSILLCSGGQYMLVDTGENDQGDTVLADLKALGVKKLAAIVGTHPHSDHIGGMDTVIKAMPVDAVYMSKKTANTETYEDVLDAMADKGLQITVPKPGDKLKFGEAELEFLWPPADFDSDNVNDCSIVIRVTAGGHTVLLCGDIEKKAEKGILELGRNIKCDVLKVAHHGSDTSSTKAFLEQVEPQYALISVGAHNDYKHPDPDVLKRLDNMGAKVHRTDLNGTITVTIAGGKLSVQDSKGTN